MKLTRFIAVCMILIIAIAGLYCAAEEKTTIHVLFDETRQLIDADDGQVHCSIESTAWYGISELAQQLRNSGYTVDALTVRPISSKVLAGVDIFVIARPNGYYLPSEIEAIQKFVHAGGGLLLASGTWRGGKSFGADNVARAFGLSFADNGIVRTDHTIFGYDSSVFRAYTQSSHPIINGIDSYLSWGTYIDELSDAVVIAATDDHTWFDSYTSNSWDNKQRDPDEKSGPFPVLVVKGYGQGRVVAGNGLFLLNIAMEKMEGDKRLATNIMEWLASDWTETGNQLPIARFTWDAQGYDETSGYLIRFDASLSHDPDGKVTMYEWDWESDGKYDERSASPEAEHFFSQAGMYAVTLRVHDDAGATSHVIRSEVDGADYWWAYAQEAYDLNSGSGRKDADLAIAAYKKVIALQPDTPAAYEAIAVIQQRVGKYQASVDTLLKLLSITDDPKVSAWALTALGFSYRYLGSFEAAEERLQEALLLDPNNAWAHRYLGDVYNALGKYPLARTEFALARSAGAPDVDMALATAATYFAEGDYQEALTRIRTVVEANPDNGIAKIMLGDIYLLQGNAAEAISQFEAAAHLLEGEDDFYRSKLGLVWTFLYLGKPSIDRAADALRQAQDKAPKTLRAFSELHLWTAVARMAAVQGDENGARKASSRALARAREAQAQWPVGRDLAADLVFCYGYLGHWNEAADQYHRALSLSYGDAASDIVIQDLEKFFMDEVADHLFNAE